MPPQFKMSHVVLMWLKEDSFNLTIFFFHFPFIILKNKCTKGGGGGSQSRNQTQKIYRKTNTRRTKFGFQTVWNYNFPTKHVTIY